MLIMHEILKYAKQVQKHGKRKQETQKNDYRIKIGKVINVDKLMINR